MRASFSIALLGTLLLTGALPSLRGDALELLPETKVPLIVPEGERNPFAVKAAPVAQVVPTDQESEESRLRGLLSALKVTGFSDGAGGASVLLGPYLLRPGELVPPLMRHQTERIQVAAITRGRIELVFLEPQDRPPSRRLTIQFSTEPKVRFLLGTQIPPRPRTQALEGIFPSTAPSPDETVSSEP